MRKVFFRNPLTQEIGLRFRKAAPQTLYIFDFKKDVTNMFSMWFVFYSIDIYFLNAQKKIVDKKHSFRPFTTYVPKKPYRYAVETTPGLLKKKIGEKIHF